MIFSNKLAMDNGLDSQPEAGNHKRRNKQKKKNLDRTQDRQQSLSVDKPQDVNSPKDGGRKKKNRKKKDWVPDDRYYGRFHCKICQHQWDSSKVYTFGGTKIVKFRQRCQNCEGEDAWCFPYRLDLLRCSQCRSQVCQCVCEDCGKLKHKRYLNRKDKNRQEDPAFEYCRCERRKDVPVGLHIDQKKPHRSDLCEKCLKGFPCTNSDSERNNYDPDVLDSEQ